ncbi:hypothetical protein BCS42_00445 [Crenothrix sp. D3]|nr:hypothetical protein BCS42_00445 [Crenothrix sp. D3]
MMMNNLEKLVKHGCLGFYDQVEITEVFAFLPDKTVINILTIVVAENRGEANLIKPTIVSEKMIKLNSLKGWIFGINRYTKLIADILTDFMELNTHNKWLASGKELLLGKIEYQEPKFVTPDELTPINNILKNNFWNGSYIAEWFDEEKLHFKPFLDNPPLLQELSEKIQIYCPIALASVSDRLGNIIFQVPITILMTKFGHSGQENNLQLKMAWHPEAKPRPLRLNCEMEHDQLIAGYFSCEVKDEITIIPMNHDCGLHKGIVWDDKNKLILAATRPNAFIRAVSFGMGIVEHEPRIFKIHDGENKKEIRVGMLHKQRNRLIGLPSSKPEYWTQERLYKDEKEILRKGRKFVQYKPNPNKDTHELALNDLRKLIHQYGEYGVWLWDPYLNAHDVINTLFYCSFIGAELRAITNLETYSESKKTSKKEQLENQRNIFNELESNFYGLRLEFRARIGNTGWDFHDRFLIFPNTQQGTLAWSLGTSVNSLGKKHHILQQVDDGQLIADAFIELWNQLDKPDNLLWKHL